MERVLRIGLGLCATYTLFCASDAHAACGDGVLEPASESCDDANTTTGDGCNRNCQTEAGYVCTATGGASLCCFTDVAAAYSLQSSASFNASTGEVTLVPDEQFKVGVAWFRQTLDFTEPFTIALRLYLGTRDGDRMNNLPGSGPASPDPGADGGSVLFHRDPRGLMAVGEYGGELGAKGLMSVLGVEFDTFNNGPGYNDDTTGDEDHVSVFHTAAGTDANHLTQNPVCMNEGTTCQDFEDGKYHLFRVEWTGNVDQTLRVWVDDKQRIEIKRNLIADFFGGDPRGIYFGFAASTGMSQNLHKFCPWAPVGYSVPRDADGDGVDDSIDLDDDGDGRSDRDETGGMFPNDDPSADRDRDGIPNYRDTDYWGTVLKPGVGCVDVVAPIGACDSLPPEIDFDQDGVPDHLDTDSDKDTVSDAEEDGGQDVDRDGRLDGCTPVTAQGVCPGDRRAPPDSDGDGAIDSRDPDSDGDDVGDASDPARLDPCVPNASSNRCLNADSDGDGTKDNAETPAGRLDPCMPNPRAPVCASGDADGDGLSNGFECPGGRTCIDTDGDGRADYDDADADDDGAPDGSECVTPQSCASSDADGDGTPDWLDPDRPEVAGGSCSAVGEGRTRGFAWLLLALFACFAARRVRRGM